MESITESEIKDNGFFSNSLSQVILPLQML